MVAELLQIRRFAEVLHTNETQESLSQVDSDDEKML